MPALKRYPNKICIQCGKSFNRWTRDGRREPSWDFEARKFCKPKCFRAWNQGVNHPLFKAEGSRRYDGYIRVARGGRRVYLHRWLMEEYLGRKLKRNEHVHHQDGDPENNVLSNLKLTTNSQHLKIHYAARKAAGRINDKGQFA